MIFAEPAVMSPLRFPVTSIVPMASDTKFEANPPDFTVNVPIEGAVIWDVVVELAQDAARMELTGTALLSEVSLTVPAIRLK